MVEVKLINIRAMWLLLLAIGYSFVYGLVFNAIRMRLRCQDLLVHQGMGLFLSLRFH